MTDGRDREGDSQRMKPPFPTRRQVHGARIPARPTPIQTNDGAGSTPTATPAGNSATGAAPTPGSASTAPVRRQAPRRPRYTETAAGGISLAAETPPPAPAQVPATPRPPVQQSAASAQSPSSPDKPRTAVRRPVPKYTDTPKTEAVQPATREPAAAPSSEPSATVESRGFPAVRTSSVAKGTASSTAEPSTSAAQKSERTKSDVLPVSQPQPLLQMQNQRPVGKPAGNGADDKRRRKRQRGRRWRTAILAILIIGGLAAGAWWAFSGLGNNSGGTAGSAETDYPGPGHGEVQVTIEPGDLGSKIGERLQEAGVIKTVGAFTAAFNANTLSASIQPGTYTLKLEMSAVDALAALLDEANRTENTVTVIPGQTVKQVTDRMIDVGGFDKSEIDAIVANPSTVGLPEVAGNNLEGWLWAGSYEISSGDDAASVMTRMVAGTVDYLTDEAVPEDKWQETLIIASIVEREVAWSEYMPKVSRVIFNRLADPAGETLGKLQMDSTVLYGAGKTGGIPTKEDLETDTPYNTYLNAGLPATPIASPSAEAIDATLNPDVGNWLYFVTVNLETGETLFTDSYDQTLLDTQLLTIWCDENPGQC